MEKKKYIYLDDIRTPLPNPSTHDAPEWIIVRNYEEFVQEVNEIGLENIELISLDHDLGDSAMKEWLHGVVRNYEINYDNITEKTGMDCVKWLVNQWLDGKPLVNVMVHSANAVGAANMMGYINNYRHINRLPQNCTRWEIPHSV
jgi:hypothetical protein